MTVGLPAAPTKADPADTAARQLEAFFLRQLLAEARPTGGGGIDGGFAGDTFKQMLDEALADKMASAGGLGLAEIFKRQLQQMPGASAQTAPLPPTATAALARPAPHHQIAAAAAPLPGALPIASPPPQVGPLVDGAPQFAMPVAGRRSSGYGERVDPIHQTRRMHAGFDIAAPTGTHVAAAASGEVVHAGPAGTYGNLVRVRHADGFETRYAHLSRVDVKVGDRVELGQAIGAVGSTGHSTGPHLHFEIRKEGAALDPSPYLPLHRPTKRATP